MLYLVDIVINERVNDFEKICIKCGKMYSEHPEVEHPLEDSTPSFYSVTNVPGIQTMSIKDS